MRGMRPTPWLLAFAAVCGLAVTACSDRITSYEPAGVVEEERGDTFQPARYWAMLWVTTTVIDAPILSSFEFLATQSRDYYVLEWEETGGHVYQHETKCALEISEVVGIQASMPQQFFDCCASRTTDATLSDMVVGADYSADVFTLYGAALGDPWEEDLPTDPDDPRVEDTDLDGHPGITSIIEGWLGDGYAEVYVTQRAHTVLDGRVISAGRIEGYIDQVVEQTVLGASEGDDWASGDGYGTRPDGVPEHNYFILQALDTPMDCATMNSLPDKDALFE